jgi:hypothetical protein
MLMRSLALVLFSLCLVPVARAQKHGPLPSHSPSPVQLKLMGTTPDKDIKLGSWVEYAVTDGQEKKNYRMKIAFVGREGGGRFSWLEIALTGLGRPIHLKLYMEGTPGTAGTVKRLIMQVGAMQPMELPMVKLTDVLPMIHQKPILAPKVVGSVDLRTPAGQFPGALHLRAVNAEGQLMNFYHHKQALMWSLVKLQDGRFEMELVGQGLGAVSRIRQTPVPFHLPK